MAAEKGNSDPNNKELPATLYKYANWNNEYHKRLITSPEIYLAYSDSFNDPFDCAVSPRYEKWTIDERKELIRQSIKRKNASIDDLRLRKQAEEEYSGMERDYEFRLKQVRRNQNNFIHNFVGISCYSTIKDSILMWSHYSSSHTGFCIGYDRLKLFEIVLKYVESLNPVARWVGYIEVDYRKDYPDIKPSTDLENIDDFVNRLAFKFDHWRYEQEWRLTVGLKRGEMPFYERIIKIPIDAISEIYLGMNMLEQNIAEIIAILKRMDYRCPLYRMKKIDYSYQLAHDEIEI
jgi:hypothetical protein